MRFRASESHSFRQIITKDMINSNIIPEQRRKEIIESIIGFFMDERGEEIGVIAAESLLDFILEEVGKDVYNKGIDETIKILKEQYNNMETDILLLKKRLKPLYNNVTS